MHTDRAAKQKLRAGETDRLSELSAQLVQKEKEIQDARQDIKNQEHELTVKLQEFSVLEEKFKMGNMLRGTSVTIVC